MAYWFETYDTTPANNTSTPPDGAPEGHFPSAVNDIARQAMAATAELGGLILAADTGGAPPRPAAVALTDGFAQLVYDLVNPVGKVVIWNSKHDGVEDAKVYPVPGNVTATWQRCDGTNNTPDTRKKAIGGGDAVDASPAFTGNTLPATQTGGGSEILPAGVTGSFALTQVHLPSVNLGHTLAVGTAITNGTTVIRAGATIGGNAGAQITGLVSPTINTLSLASGAVSGTISLGGSNTPHGHSVPAIDLTTHTHLTGLPARVALEYWQRTA